MLFNAVQDCIKDQRVGFCVISPWSLSRFLSNHLQTTKRHSYDGYSIYIAIFNSFHGAVYPVGVTTNRSCFTRIIGHNSRTIHRICTKVDARIRLRTPFLCAKFQGDWSTRLRFIAIFASKTRRRKKTKKKNQTLAARILDIPRAISFTFGM